MTVQTRVKERAEEQSSAMTPDQQAAIRMVANDLHRLNQAVMKAVEAGVSVELVRSAPPSRRRRQLGRPADPRHRHARQALIVVVQRDVAEAGDRKIAAGESPFDAVASREDGPRRRSRRSFQSSIEDGVSSLHYGAI